MLKGNKKVPAGLYVLNIPLTIITRKENYIPQLHVHLELAQTKTCILSDIVTPFYATLLYQSHTHNYYCY